jgi:hypothetical protein
MRANISAEIRAGRTAAQAQAIARRVLEEACKDEGKAVPKMDAADKGIQVLRYDDGEFSSPVRTANGYLKCDARITRVGVFSYRQADGSVRRELRLPGDVFRGDSLDSFENAPLTNGHPGEPLTAKNTRKWGAGNIRQVKRNDRFVAAKVLVTDEDAIKDVEAGKTQLSCGYHCDLDFTPGVTRGIEGVEDGLRYDAIQSNIVGNHVAIVGSGRAGAETALHLDGEDAAMVDDTPEPTGPTPGPVGGRHMTMKVMRIDGVDFEMSEQAAQAVQKMVSRLDSLEEQLAKLKTESAQNAARADKAEEDLEAEKKARKEDASDERTSERVRARVELETTAQAVFKDDEIDLPAMADLDIKKAVVVKVSPAAKSKLDGADAAYVEARYDAALEAWEADRDSEPTERDPKRKPRTAKATGAQRTDAWSHRERMIEDLARRSKDPIPQTPIPPR